MKTKICCSLLALSLMACQSIQVQEDNVTKTVDNQLLKIDTDKPKYEEFVIAGNDLPITSVVDISGNDINLANTNK